MTGPVGVGAAEVLETTDDVVEMELGALLEMLELVVREPESVVELLTVEPVLELIMELVDDITVLELEELEHGTALQSGVYFEAS